MDLRIFCEPQQGATYDDILALARCAEEGGFSAFFRSDHYLTMGDVSGLPGPSDAWITLAGLARDTSRIRLGTLLTSATFRLPGPLAIAVGQVDAMSHGRVELGLGAGWFDQEHTAYGVAFPSLLERFEKLEEQLAIVTGLWTTGDDEVFNFAGQHYSLADSPALPKTVQKIRPPIIVGGDGRAKTSRLAATYADEFNVPFASVLVGRELNELVDAACEAIGRDPGSLIRPAAQVVCAGRDESSLTRRASAIGRELPELRENGLAGTPDELIEKIRTFADAGFSRLYLQVLDFSDLDHARLLASEVLPEVL